MGPHVLRLTGGRTGHRREMEEGLLIIVCCAPAWDALSPAPTSLNVLSLSLSLFPSPKSHEQVNPGAFSLRSTDGRRITGQTVRLEFRKREEKDEFVRPSVCMFSKSILLDGLTIYVTVRTTL